MRNMKRCCYSISVAFIKFKNIRLFQQLLLMSKHYCSCWCSIISGSYWGWWNCSWKQLWWFCLQFFVWTWNECFWWYSDITWVWNPDIEPINIVHVAQQHISKSAISKTLNKNIKRYGQQNRGFIKLFGL